MSVETMYLAKIGAEDAYIDAATHTVPVSASVTRSVTGLAAYFYRIDGTGTAGTGNWETSGKMTASYFVATHASTPSVFPVATVSTTLNVVNASTFQVDATSLDCAVAANFTAAVAMTAGLTSNTAYIGSAIPTGSEKLKSESLRTTTIVVETTSTLTGNVSMGGTLAVTGATTLSSTLAVTGATTHTGAVALNGGGNVPSGQTLTVAGTLTVSGTFNIATLVATATATIAGATGGSEALRTTTFRATGTSTLVGAVSASSTMTVSGVLTAEAGATMKGTTSIHSAGGIDIAGTAGLFQLPGTSDTSTATTLDLDALQTSNSHQFGPSGARTLASGGVTGTRSGAYWFINTHGSNAVTIHTDQMDTPSGTFTLAANTTAVLWWDANTSKFFQISH